MNWVVEFLRIMGMNPKNHPDNLTGSVAIF
jgi:hypothetical protein